MNLLKTYYLNVSFDLRQCCPALSSFLYNFVSDVVVYHMRSVAIVINIGVVLCVYIVSALQPLCRLEQRAYAVHIYFIILSRFVQFVFYL